MKSRIVFGACALLLLSSGYGHGDECDRAFTAKNRSPGLWAFEQPAKPSASTGTWVWVHSKTSLPLHATEKFAYVGRRTKVDADHQGALSIKFARFAKAGDTRVKAVTLERPALESTCGLRWFLQFISFPLDFIGGQQVDVDDYITYHATDSSADSTLQRFHINYESEADNCVGTDSSKGNRRTAFLANYDGKVTSNRKQAIVAAVHWLLPPAAADESRAGGSNRREKLREILASEEREFNRFAAFESQIQTYDLNGRVCVSFTDSGIDRIAKAAYRVEIVDLDARGHSRKGRRHRWTIYWK